MSKNVGDILPSVKESLDLTQISKARVMAKIVVALTVYF